jgi:cell division protein FtsI (penicillin-binding protein 3)
VTRHRPAFKRMLMLRRRIVLAIWIVSSVLVVGRSAQIQIIEGPNLKKIAVDQQQHPQSIPGARGAILDRNGIALGVSHERVRVSVAPREIINVPSVTKLLAQTLDLDADVVASYTNSARRWKVFPESFPPSIRDDLLYVSGVYLEQEYPRVNPHGDLATSVLGTIRDGKGRGGIEQVWDTILTGKEGRALVSRDGNMRPIPGQKVILDHPGKGGQVQLTLDIDMQQIGRNNLAAAIQATEAEGGDLVIIDPQNGDVLAMVSIHNGSANSLSAITTPYEPGSTLKPFTVAGLVHNGLASLADTVDTGIGSWEINKRTIHDVHPEGGVMSLSHALQISSNVGIAKAAQVLTDTIQYENLRDFGFGVATGIRLPGEGRGMLRHPKEWGIQSAVSLAIGYEISVTPLQMAMAYGALANGGKLYKPRIVKEVRDAQGKIEKVPSRVVRRVVSPTVTKEISEVLVGVIEDGTGRRAGLSTFAVAGKSGTTRAWSNGSYEEGAYFSSFVGFFPAEDPQVVILVKLDRPEGAYYGGATAAPVIRATMTDILASPRQLLDWTSLGDLQIPPENPLPKSAMMLASNLSVGVTTSDITSESHVEVSSDTTTVVVMPDVRGLTSRSAVSMIHELGLRVQWSGTGKILETNPRAGLVVSKGDTVSLVSRRSDGDG